MSKKLLLNFLFVFILIVIFSVNTKGAVYHYGYVPNINLAENGTLYLWADSYLEEYDKLEIDYICLGYDTCFDTLEVNFSTPDNRTDTACEEQLNITLSSDPNEAYVRFEARENNHSYCYFNMTGTNTSDSTFYWLDFYVYTGYTSPPIATASINHQTVVGNDTAFYNMDWFFNYYEDICVSYAYNDSAEEMCSQPATIVLVDDNPHMNITLFNDGQMAEMGQNILAIQGKDQDYSQMFWVSATSYNYPDEVTTAQPFWVYFESESGTGTPLNDTNAPSQIASFTSWLLYTDQHIYLYFNNFFDDYYGVSVSYWDPDANTTISLNAEYGMGYENCNVGDIRVCLTGQPNNVIMLIDSQGVDYQEWFFVDVYNGYATQEVSFYINTSSVGVTSDDDLTGSNSVFSMLTGWFNKLFPDKDEMTSQQRFGFVFVSIFAVTILLAFLSYNMHWGSFAIYPITILDFMLIFYFIIIGYIPVSYLIGFGVLATVVFYLKSRGGGY